MPRYYRINAANNDKLVVRNVCAIKSLEMTNRRRLLKKLWLIVFVGMLLRELAILFYNPLAATQIDSMRHFVSSLTDSFPSVVSMLDPPLYHAWLSLFSRFFAANIFVMFGYCILISLAMPWPYYFWMRACFKDELYALIGLIFITYLPTYLSVYCSFMPETLLLLLQGVALWVTTITGEHVAHRNPHGRLWLALTAICWGLSLVCKMTAVTTCIPALLWLWWKIHPFMFKRVWQRAILGQLVIITVIYAWAPLEIYSKLHYVELSPGMLHINQYLYESGKNLLVAKVHYWNNGSVKELPLWIGTPVLKERTHLFSPFNKDWTLSRQGETKTLSIDYTRSQAYPPSPPCTFTDRLRYTWENILIFLLGSDYPGDQRAGFLFRLHYHCRWLWLPLIIFTTALCLRFRLLSQPIFLAAFAALFFMVQQSSCIEGRYRITWESLIVVASLDAFRLAKKAKRRAAAIN
jgi:hypothetical protein